MTIAELPPNVEQELSRYSPLVRRLLFNRGIEDRETARAFMFPSYEDDIHDPFLMLGMDIAVERLYRAVKNDEKIAVYADYDCDGIPGAIVLHDFLKKIGHVNLEIYIPDRHKEGYGLNMDAVSSIAASGAKLLITVDLGITAVEETLRARELGLDVIITDHHMPQEVLPDALVVLNPKKPGDTYPFDMLCGAGVAFKLAQGFIKKHGKEFGVPTGFEKWLLDMVGLATLADMVPLRGENRVFAYYGLMVLRKTKRLGLQKLFRKNGLRPATLQEDDITFTICPRLNAASRMDHPMKAFDLLAADSDSEADLCADHLTKINNERKTLVATIMRSVHKTVAHKADRSVIFIGDTSWRAGILGLVAGKISDEYKKPAFVWGLEGGETIKGSCRSSGEVNLVDMMGLLPEGSLLEFGGHELAGGFSVSREAIHFLEEHLEDAYAKSPKKDMGDKTGLAIDAHFSLEEVNRETFAKVDSLAPFGVGNPKPIFQFDAIKIEEVRKFGKQSEHLELSFKDARGRTVKAIQFFCPFERLPLHARAGKDITLIAHMEKSTFGWKEEIRLRIIEIL